MCQLKPRLFIFGECSARAPSGNKREPLTGARAPLLVDLLLMNSRQQLVRVSFTCLCSRGGREQKQPERTSCVRTGGGVHSCASRER